MKVSWSTAWYSLHSKRQIQTKLDPFVAFYLSDTMGVFTSLKWSTSLETRLPNISISNSKQQVDDFVGELTF